MKNFSKASEIFFINLEEFIASSGYKVVQDRMYKNLKNQLESLFHDFNVIRDSDMKKVDKLNLIDSIKNHALEVYHSMIYSNRPYLKQFEYFGKPEVREFLQNNVTYISAIIDKKYKLTLKDIHEQE